MKTFEYGYKRYMYEDSDYFTYKITASNKRQAIIKIVMEYQGLSKQKALEFIANRMGENWTARDPISNLTAIKPVGSPDLALYRFDYIEEIENGIK